MVRALGLTSMGLNPTPMTAFADDERISSWAKQSIDAASRLGLVFSDQYGNFNPQQVVTKGEAAAFIVRLIDYMRHDLHTDYADHLLFY
jgi:hypothetical protein